MSTNSRRALLALGALFFSVIPAARPAAADAFEDSPVNWRPYGRAAFDEARESGRLVFLVLTAPWNWDHYLLPERLFAAEATAESLESRFVPVLARADRYPELRSVYRIRSGLVPSFHFTDADGRPLASVPPFGEEELSYYLDRFEEPPAPPEAGPPVELVELNADLLANRLARFLSGLRESGERVLPPVHADLDFADLHFFTEMGRWRVRKMTRGVLTEDLVRLLRSPLFDREQGGVHRAAALASAEEVHHEKLLRPNAELAAVLANFFRLSGADRAGIASRQIIRFLNEELRIGTGTLYAASLSADAFDEGGRELLLEGSLYYEMNARARAVVGKPHRNDDVPTGANFVMLQSLVTFLRAFGEDDSYEAILNAGSALLAEGFEPDGLARRFVGRPGVGNLRDQGDAGAGLLAYHGVSGDPEALRAARRLADRLLERFTADEPGILRSVDLEADVPDHVREFAPDPAWNGVVLRFLADLATVTREQRWEDRVREGFRGWSTRLPADGHGAGELGRAAFRRMRTPATVLVDADPESEAGESLARVAYSVMDPVLTVRWVEPDDREQVMRDFGATFTDEPALYLVWRDVSGPLRTPPEFEAVWAEMSDRVWARPR